MGMTLSTGLLIPKTGIVGELKYKCNAHVLDIFLLDNILSLELIEILVMVVLFLADG
jgi:hypothetical protein